MSEILFRGKRKDNSEWVEGKGIDLNFDTVYILTKEYDCGSGYYMGEFEVIPETTGQYTGLTDNNGKKIFEGDIVKFGKNIYQIIFVVGSFALYDEQGNMISKIGGHNDHCYSFMDLYIECCWEERNAYDIEVIGNMHDNPELLKGEG